MLKHLFITLGFLPLISSFYLVGQEPEPMHQPGALLNHKRKLLKQQRSEIFVVVEVGFKWLP
jgi:hypothetical protein